MPHAGSYIDYIEFQRKSQRKTRPFNREIQSGSSFAYDCVGAEISNAVAPSSAERSLIITYIVNEYPPEKSFPEGVYLCRKQKTKLISQSQAALSPSYRNRKISYFPYSRLYLQR